MANQMIYLCCLLSVIIFIQSNSMKQVSATDDLVNSKHHISKDPMENQWHSRSKRSSLNIVAPSTSQRRNSRLHWNPLLAAYRRCGDITQAVNRESCFKNAVQSLFVYKL